MTRLPATAHHTAQPPRHEEETAQRYTTRI